MNKGTRIKDSKGNTYESVRELCRAKGIKKTNILRSVAKRGYYDFDGVRYSKEEQGTNSVISQILERYTPEELALIAKGQGLQEKNTKYPDIHLHGKHHKIGVISDGHLEIGRAHV